MAFDEALLEFVNGMGHPVLRFYGWSVPAASFGYSQRFSAVAVATDLRPLIRRPTGGGIVPHQGDWTYSLVFPREHWWCRQPAKQSYRSVHGWIRDTFRDLGVVVQLAPERNIVAPGKCFEGMEEADVVWKGRKIAGAAQRRNRNGLLIQGSIQPWFGSPDRKEFEEAFCAMGSRRWNCHWIPWPSRERVSDRADVLAENRYDDPRYNEMR
jgi:lipoate-protein ligase A